MSPQPHLFCTYFDRHYLLRALALHESLRAHCPGAELWALCMDQWSFDYLSGRGLPGLRPVALEDLERACPALAAVKDQRSPVEYYFTCTPFLPGLVLERAPEADMVTYLDADLYFFADPGPVFDELEGFSVGIIAHRFHPSQAHLVKYGTYNVGWVSFRRDRSGLACLRDWQQRCLEWCFDRLEENRFADQKYLDRWPEDFPGVRVIAHKGANLAPWNLANYRLTLDRGRVRVDGEPLIFYHFHALKPLSPRVINPKLAEFKGRATALVRRDIYGPYLAHLWRLKASTGLGEPGAHPLGGIRGGGGRRLGWVHRAGGVLLRRFLLTSGPRVL